MEDRSKAMDNGLDMGTRKREELKINPTFLACVTRRKTVPVAITEEEKQVTGSLWRTCQIKTRDFWDNKPNLCRRQSARPSGARRREEGSGLKHHLGTQITRVDKIIQRE